MRQQTVRAFKAQLRGELIEPTDTNYDDERKVYNAMISRRPRMIAKCVDAADVVAAVEFGRNQDLTVSIRSGGHNAGGLGVCDDGLVIDLSLIKGVAVDTATRTVRAGCGCTWGEIDRATHAFGLAVPSGIISTTGVGGLTLGGGIGYRINPMFRTDLTFDYIPSLKASGHNSALPTLTNSADLDSLVGMANGYLDFNGFFPGMLGPFQPYINAGLGFDTVTLGFKLTDAKITWSGNQVIIEGPSSQTVLRGFERYVFADGTVDNADSDGLVDDLFYYARNHDVWNVKADADAHFN